MNNTSNELFQRYLKNPILTVNDWSYPANSVFNCGAALVDGTTVLLVRVEDRRGLSHFTVAKSQNGMTEWSIDPKPSWLPDPIHYPEETWGIEDPRVTYLEEMKEYGIAYTAYSDLGPLVSLAKTKDFVTFNRLGAVLSPENKDAALFPIRFNNKWAIVHRPVIQTPHSAAHIWISFSPDLIHWGEHRILIRAREGGWWDAHKIGMSSPPIQTPRGWIVLYHGVRKTGGGVIYRLGVALLDLHNPTKVLRRGDEWIFGPREHYEREGDVDDVVFPCGCVVQDNEVRLYYGSADTCIGLATANLNNLLQYVLSCPEPTWSSRLR